MPRLAEFKNEAKKLAPGMAEYSGLPYQAGVLIMEKIATLHELQTIYSWQDMIRMHELVIVSRYNEWNAGKNAEAFSKRPKGGTL